jgi:hypothetical protein
MNWKVFGRKWSWPNRSTIPEFSCPVWGSPRKTSLSRYLNRAHPEYISSVLSLRPTARNAENIMSRAGGTRDKKTGSRSDDWIYCHFGYNISLFKLIKCYRWFTQFTVHRCTRTRILSFHQSSPSNGFQHRNYHFKSLWSLLVLTHFLSLCLICTQLIFTVQ